MSYCQEKIDGGLSISTVKSSTRVCGVKGPSATQTCVILAVAYEEGLSASSAGLLSHLWYERGPVDRLVCAWWL
jgi:hypothetical protein